MVSFVRKKTLGRLALVLAILVGASSGGLFAASAEPTATPGTRPASSSRLAPLAAMANGGLQVMDNERGHVSKSIAGFTSDDSSGTAKSIRKPADATVRKAYLAYATTGFTGSALSQPLTLDGQPVPLTNQVSSGISSYNYFADVTSLVKPKVDAAPAGPVSITVAEPQPELTEGEILEVVYDDPAITVDQTVSILYGALNPSGDSYRIQLASPISLSNPATRLEMSLGISYSFQIGGVQQYSTVDVNGRRLTTSAGGEDDGASHNGALLTVGDDTDSTANPTDPQATPTGPRSDDELYDLRPFVANGDTSIKVDTANPSLDDNVFLATFTMNPPVTEVATGKKFVYVALGDSYSSGEGVGFNVQPDSTYSSVYENGVNAPDNTYAAGGSGCHRALQNYAKLSRDHLAPNADVVMVDRTCSGATTVGVTSQIQQALDALRAQHLTAGDVGVVTVGVGGNDAKFSDIAQDCAFPAILSELLRRYPHFPAGPEALADQISCGLADLVNTQSDLAIAQLAGKETQTEQTVLNAFPNARVLQVNYPDILPAKNSPAWCGGILARDVSYARQQLKKIDSAIGIASGAVGLANPRLQLVDQQNAFGGNALCPGAGGRVLANGVDRQNFDAEIGRLLNLDGHGDAVFRGKLDAVVTAYKAWKNCIANTLNPFDGSSCSMKQKTADMVARIGDAYGYLTNDATEIVEQFVAPHPFDQNPPTAAADRSQELFHPNANGFAVQACDVLDVWNSTRSNCTSAMPTTVGKVNGTPVSNNPVVVAAGKVVQIVMSGFQALSQVHLRLFSQPVDISDVKADADGTVSGSFTMPSLNPGVHTLELEGVGTDGVQVTQQALLSLPGRPSGEYATYLCCFAAEPATIAPDAPHEQVEVTVGGISLGTFYPDEDGGVLVHVPTIDRLRDSSDLTIEAKSTLTGKVVRQVLNPIPTAPSLWATSADPSALSVTGIGFAADGRIHSEGGIQVVGAATKMQGGVEYGTQLKVTGLNVTIAPAAVKVAAGQGGPAASAIADYRPGGSVQATGQQYRAVPANSCKNGVWTPTAKDVSAGIVYVPCGVSVLGRLAFPATIAAEGPITLAGDGSVIGPATPGAPSLITGSTTVGAISLVGANIELHGTAYAPNGKFTSTGVGIILQCGVVAAKIGIVGASTSATLGARCLS